LRLTGDHAGELWFDPKAPLEPYSNLRGFSGAGNQVPAQNRVASKKGPQRQTLNLENYTGCNWQGLVPLLHTSLLQRSDLNALESLRVHGVLILARESRLNGGPCEETFASRGLWYSAIQVHRQAHTEAVQPYAWGDV
jgi:hypothetical protein